MAVFSIIYGVTDGKNEKSSFTVNIPDTFTVAQITGFATQLLPLVNALVTGGLTSVGLSLNLDSILTGGIGAAAANSDVEEGAKWTFGVPGGFLTSLRLPTFDEQFILPGTRLVDEADPAVAAFQTAMVAGLNVGGTQVQPSDTRGEDIVDILSAVESFYSSRA
jgi:hypothetical protein